MKHQRLGFMEDIICIHEIANNNSTPYSFQFQFRFLLGRGWAPQRRDYGAGASGRRVPARARMRGVRVRRVRHTRPAVPVRRVHLRLYIGS